MKLWLVVPVVIALIPIVALIDFYLFGRWAKCQKCGEEYEKRTWVLACTLEFMFFLAGLLMGVSL